MIEKLMSWWRRTTAFVKSRLGLTGMSWYVATWIGHGLVVMAFAFLAGRDGYVFGVGFYTAKELKEVGQDPTFQASPWYDHVGDVVGPIVLGPIGLLLRGIVFHA